MTRLGFLFNMAQAILPALSRLKCKLYDKLETLDTFGSDTYAT